LEDRYQHAWLRRLSLDKVEVENALWCLVGICTRFIKSRYQGTWMSTWDKRYTDRVQLLVEILPLLSLEPSLRISYWNIGIGY